MVKKPIVIRITIIIGIALGAAGLAAGFLDTRPLSGPAADRPGAPPRPVKSVVVQSSRNMEKRTFPGLVQSANETRLAFRVSGILNEMNGSAGRKVKKGDLIARLDPRDFEINIRQIQAALDEAAAALAAMETGARKEDIAALTARVNAARADFERSEKQMARLDMLIKAQVITRTMHDQGVADVKTSRAAWEAAVQTLEKARNGARKEEIQAAVARVRQLEARLTAARYALSDTRLTAPFDGVVNRKFVENFETVAAGHPVISLLDVSRVDVKTAIPEEVLLNRTRFVHISCTMDAYPGRVFDARIAELGLKTDTANQSFPLTVSLDVPEGIDIQPGMTASVTIEYPRTGRAGTPVRLPSTAIFADSGGTAWAWKIDPDTGCVARTPVCVERISGAELAVTAGLNPGDRIVTAGARFLQDGRKVRIMDDHKGL